MKHRRWLQFRLKWLLLFVTVLSAPLSWLGWRLEEKRRERWAEDKLSKLSVRIIFEYPDLDDLFGDGKSPPSRWFKRLLGKDVFVHVTIVNSCYSTVDLGVNARPLAMNVGITDRPPLTDADLVHLRHFPGLQVLTLEGSQVTAAGLSQLRQLSQLELLDLGWIQPSDRTLAELRKALSNCKIQGRCLP
ncbi:MAG TPA: hypothetical protein VF278_21245 [Pirellulales bacterium]